MSVNTFDDFIDTKVEDEVLRELIVRRIKTDPNIKEEELEGGFFHYKQHFINAGMHWKPTQDGGVFWSRIHDMFSGCHALWE